MKLFNFSRFIITLITSLLFSSVSVFAQVAPQAEPVYGGYVEGIDNYATTSTSTRVFASTMSPNSMFYADITNVNTTSPSFSGWTVMPDLDITANHGNINCFAVDENSGYVYANTMAGQFVGTNTTGGSLFTIGNFWVEAVEAYNSRLFWQMHLGMDEWMFVADLDASGNLINIDSSLIATAPGWTSQFRLEIHINKYNNHVYFFVPGTPPIIYKSSDPYTTISNSTTWSQITVSDLTATGKEYVSMGIAPDGRLFAGSYEGNSSGFTAQVSYTDADGDPWTTVPLLDDCGRGKFSVSNSTSGSYMVYFSRAYSDNKGLTWQQHGGADGAIICDPNNENFAYVRTDWAMGLYNNYSTNVTEINTGMQAVQVNDWDMNLMKDTAWVASKSGVWHVGGYGSGSPSWSSPIWPNWNTVPWTEVEVYLSYDPLYCGNTNGDVFSWTSSNGSYTDPMSYDTVFIAHDDAPYPNYTWTYGTWVSGIAMDPYYTHDRVFIGLYDNEDWNEPEALGAVFVGANPGTGWVFTQILSSPMISAGCDVNDLVVVYESSNCVCYTGVEYNTTFGTVNGIYRIEETAPFTWSVSNDLFTGPGYPISATIKDLHVSYNDTIFACGIDVAGLTPVSYKKQVGDTYWEALPTNGLPTGSPLNAIAYDGMHYDVYVASENKIFKLANGATSWTPYWTYPNGTQINCLYYDDLMVGTNTGLYSHFENVGIDENNDRSKDFIKVYPNPFSDEVSFSFHNRKHQNVKLDILNNKGQLIETVFYAKMKSGDQKLIWSPNQNTLNTSSVYHYSLTCGNKQYGGKLVKAP